MTFETTLTDEDIINAVFSDISLLSPEEVQSTRAMIAAVKAMTGAEIDTLIGAFTRGPLHDGDVASKTGRDSLVEKGWMARVIFKCEYGYNACTYKGAAACRIMFTLSDNLRAIRDRALIKTNEKGA